jgi:hypothetical protein
MNALSKKLEQLIRNSQEILPVKTEKGILVSDVLISSNNNLKNLFRSEELIYKDVHLNIAAIRLANLLAKRQDLLLADKIYQADREYGKWYVDSQMLRVSYEKSLKNQNYDRADMLWARYCESRDRAIQAKKLVESLTII